MILYAALGAVLALGAPLGLVVVRLLERPTSTIRSLVAADPVLFAYVAVSTLLAFTFYGAWLGHKDDRLKALADRDPLTGLLNRRAFLERVDEETRRAARHPASISLLLLDVDHLKELNDDGGHDAGDAALIAVAAAIQISCRSIDVGARWGGDEFTVLLPSTSKEAGRAIAERIQETLRARGTTVSVGISSTAPDRPTKDLFAAADASLYEAKRAGRDRIGSCA
jgi:diguanylate cyclase (GGDEF)-like protein